MPKDRLDFSPREEPREVGQPGVFCQLEEAEVLLNSLIDLLKPDSTLVKARVPLRGPMCMPVKRTVYLPMLV